MDNVNIRDELDAALHQLKFLEGVAQDRLDIITTANDVNAKLQMALDEKNSDYLALGAQLEDIQSRLSAVTKITKFHQAIFGSLELKCSSLFQAYEKTDDLVSLLCKVALDLNEKNCVSISPTTKNRILHVVGEDPEQYKDQENVVPHETDADFDGEDGKQKSRRSIKVYTGMGSCDEDDSTCYYEIICGGGSSVGDMGHFEKPLNEGNIPITRRKRRKTTVLSPDVGEQTQESLLGMAKRCVPLVSTPHPFGKNPSKN